MNAVNPIQSNLSKLPSPKHSFQEKLAKIQTQFPIKQHSSSSSLSPFRFQPLSPATPNCEPALDWKEISDDFSQISPLRMTWHGNEVDQLAVDQKAFFKFSRIEREKECLVTVCDRLICVGGVPLTTDGKMNYVLLKSGKIYTAYPIDEKLFHSSLVQDDEEVIAAGTWLVFHGIAKLMDEESGHFKPHNRVGLAAASLRVMGCDLSQLRVVVSRYAPISDTERTPKTPKEKLEVLQKILSGKQSPAKSSEEKKTPSREPTLQNPLKPVNPMVARLRRQDTINK